MRQSPMGVAQSSRRLRQLRQWSTQRWRLRQRSTQRWLGACICKGNKMKWFNIHRNYEIYLNNQSKSKKHARSMIYLNKKNKQKEADTRQVLHIAMCIGKRLNGCILIEFARSSSSGNFGTELPNS